jgi:hypothetical protein
VAIFTFIATAIAGALFGGSVLAASIIAAGLAYAANLAISYLFRPKDRKYSAVQGEVQLGGDIPASVVFGATKVKGHRIYYNKRGAGDAWNDEIFVLSNGRCDGLEPYCYFYGKKQTLVSETPLFNEHARYSVAGFGASIVIRFYDGRPGQLEDNELVTQTAGTATPWKSTSRVSGHAYVVVSKAYSAGLFDQGAPEFEWVLRGLRQYDPRKDSTVAGGSGLHRLNDASTWQHTTNPAIHRLNYLLGLKGLVSGDTLVGVGRTVNQIDIAAHMVAANVCDATRTVGARTISTYAASLFVQAQDDHLQILAEFEDAMAGYAVNNSGFNSVIAGAPQVPVLTITNNDIRAGEAIESVNRLKGQDAVNSLTGQYTSIENMWNAESLTPVYSNADITFDGGKRAAANDFLQVTDPDIAQYLLNIRYRQNRYARKITLPVSRNVGCRIRNGEWVTYDGRSWLITNWAFDGFLQFTLQLSETNAAIYSESGITPGPVITPSVPPANPSILSTVAGFTAAAGNVTGTDGQQVPALQFGWTNPNDPTIIAVVVEYWTTATPTRIFTAVSYAPSGGTLVTLADVLPDASYVARATILTSPDRLKTYTANVAVASATATNPAINWVGLSTDVRQWLTDQNQDVANLVTGVALSDWNDAFQGLGNLVETLTYSRQTGLANAEVAKQTILRTDADKALATTIESVRVSLGNATAGGLFRMSAEAAADGATSQISLYSYSALGGLGARAGFTIQTFVTSGVATSRIILAADQTLIADSAGNVSAMFNSTGAYIGNITASYMKSPSGNFVIDLANSFLKLSKP